VADEHDRPRDVVDREVDARDVALQRVQAVLRGEHLVPLGLEGRDELVEARTVRPQPVREDDAGLGRHTFLSSIDAIALLCAMVTSVIITTP
jgi:hypothetical protein